MPPQSDHFSSVEPGKWYFKVGRTTNLEFGLCNGVEAWVNLAYQHTLFGAKGAVKEVRRVGKILETDREGRRVYDKKGKLKEMQGDIGYYYSSEWIIINGSIDPQTSNTQREFCAPGDSGSLIINQWGGVAGILWGEVTGYCGPMAIGGPYVKSGLVTCIKDVKEFMKIGLGWHPDEDVEVLLFP